MSVLPSDCGAPATDQQMAMHCSRTHARTKCRRRRLPVLTGLGTPARIIPHPRYGHAKSCRRVSWAPPSWASCGAIPRGVRRAGRAQPAPSASTASRRDQLRYYASVESTVRCREHVKATTTIRRRESRSAAPRLDSTSARINAPALPHWVGLRFLHGGHGSGDRPEQGGVAAGAIRLCTRSQMHAMHECCIAGRRQQAASLRPCSPRCDEALRRAGGLEAGGATCVGGAAQTRGAESRHHGEG